MGENLEQGVKVHSISQCQKMNSGSEKMILVDLTGIEWIPPIIFDLGEFNEGKA